MNSLLLTKSWQVNHNQINSYIKAHTQHNKLVETMSHLNFNVDLVKAFIKKRKCFTPKAIIMVGAFISNPKGFHNSI